MFINENLFLEQESKPRSTFAPVITVATMVAL